MEQIPLLSTAYFPNIHYLAILAHYDKVFIDKFEFYPKQTLRTRCKLLSPNGVMSISVPVLLGRRKRNIPIYKIEIDYSQPWISKHLNTIRTAYGSAPFFEFYFDAFAQVLKAKPATLLELNEKILKLILEFIGLDTQIEYIDKFYSKEELPKEIIDYRYITNPKHSPSIFFDKYPQVFEDKFGFVPNLCALDLLFNLGSESISYLRGIKV